MNNLKKAGVMFVIAALTITMVLVPFTPMAQIQPVATPNSITPEEVLMDIQRYVDTQKEGGPLGSTLASYRDTGYIPTTVAVNHEGDMGALVTVRTDSDVASLDEIIDVNWKVEVGAMTLAYGFVTSPEAVTAIENFDGIVTAYADSFLKGERPTGLEPRDVISDAPPQTEPEAYAIIPEIGADQAWAAGFDGTGARIGVVDTGTDFSSPDMVDAIDFGTDGLPTSYDPTGWGFGMNLYRVNLTTVNPTAWMAASSWNILSFSEGGKTYINTSTYQHNGGSPYVQYFGQLYDLDFFIDGYLGFWWPNGYPNEANLTEYYYDVMRQPLELPDPATISGGGQMNVTLNATLGTWQMVPYACNGYYLQRRYDPSMRLFTPTLVVNSTKLVVDWNTSRAWTDFWNLNINYGVWDFNDTAAWDYYNTMGDWSFADDLEQGYYYQADGTSAHTNLYFDYADGQRFGLGILAHVWEPGIFGLGMVDGFALGGRAIGIMYDGDSHGTFVSAQIASRGVTQYPVGLNGSMEYLPGVAPGSTIMGIKVVTYVSTYNSLLWTAGFDYNSTSRYWEWNYESGHQMNISSNSWGSSQPQYWELDGPSGLIYAAVATPGFFNATHYPGMVICFSSGNSGPGYATAATPIAPQMISVGASTSYHTFNDAYGPDQGFDQIAGFSSRGPLALGYPRPDVLAPGANNYGLVPRYGGVFGITAGSPTAVYGGTSMACPLAAGLAALILDADDTLTPDMVKTIIQSTADDTGMDGLSQGHGVINAWAAIDFVVNNQGYSFYSYDSVANWGTAATEAWLAKMNPYQFETFVNTTTLPGSFADGNLYFGLVGASGTVTMTVEGANWVYGDMTWSAEQYVADRTTTFGFETFIYNETTSTGSDNTLAGYMLLDTLMEAESTGSYANFATADFATISITGDHDTFDDESMWAFVFDWIDNDPANGIPDYYNETTDTGDELTRWQYSGRTGNVLKMDLAYPGGLGNLFPNQPIISVHDDNIWSWPFTTGNTLEVTVQTWTLAADGNIGFADNAGDTDVTLTVPASPEYGIHQGFVIADNGTDLFKMPYTYNVYATYDTDGTAMELADGVGAVQTPYENGALTAGWEIPAGSTYGTADHASFVVDLTDATVNHLAARLNWTYADTDLDVSIVDMTGTLLANSANADKTTDNSAVAIADVSASGTGMYIIYTDVTGRDGTDVPEDFTLTVVGYSAIDEPALALSFTARDVPTPTSVGASGSAVGDHVVMKATWTDGNNPAIPEFGITNIEMKVLYGTLFYAEGLKVFASNPGGAFSGPIIESDYAWETAPGFSAGDVISVVCDFDGSDVDVMAWWSDVPMGDRTYANNLLGSDMASSNHPEHTIITALRDGDIEVGILDFANDGGHYYLTLDNRVGIDDEPLVPSLEYEIDTYPLLANLRYSVLVSSDTGTNIHYDIEIPDIWIENLFAPEIAVNQPTDLGGELYNFHWVANDRNADDDLFYSVWISSDGGSSFQILAQNLTENNYVWSASGWFEGSYIFRVRAFSFDTVFLLDGQPLGTLDDPPSSYGEFSLYTDAVSGAFSAGDVPVPTPTTPTTPTPTPTTPTPTTAPPPFDPLLIGLIGGLGVGVVVLLILFLIRKK